MFDVTIISYTKYPYFGHSKLLTGMIFAIKTNRTGGDIKI